MLTSLDFLISYLTMDFLPSVPLSDVSLFTQIAHVSGWPLSRGRHVTRDISKSHAVDVLFIGEARQEQV